MELKEIAKKAVEFMAIKKSVGLGGSLLRWGTIAGIGYLSYKMYQKKSRNNATSV